MNILVIGNGFDLAHEMPTRYSNFLDFMTLYIIKNYPDWQGWGENNFYDANNHFNHYNSILLNVSRKISENSQVHTLFDKCEENFKELLRKESSLDNFYENSFLRYCLSSYCYKQSFDSEFNWVDIENEFSHFLKKLQDKTFTKSSLNSTSVLLPYLQSDETVTTITFFIPTVHRALKSKNIPPELLRKEIFNCLFRELENFNLLLKIYLKVVSEYSKENLEKKFKIKAQDNFKINDGIFINSIVSFNYTDTVKIYTPDAPIHFVNGSLDNEKIILGIENPSSENTNFISKDIEFFF